MVKPINLVGRPTKYRKEFHPQDFIRLSKQGKTLAQIALEWDVDRDTVQEWRKRHKEFSVAIKKGREFAEAWYMNLGHLAMLNRATVVENGIRTQVDVNLGFFVWMTKNLFHWSDKVEQQVETTADVVYNLAWADEDATKPHTESALSNPSTATDIKKPEKI